MHCTSVNRYRWRGTSTMRERGLLVSYRVVVRYGRTLGTNVQLLGSRGGGMNDRASERFCGK